MAAVPAPMIVEDLWVQCDSCSKWRRLAPGTLVDENSNWYCWQHPDPNQKSCDTPEEAPQEGTISWKTAASLQAAVTGKGRKRRSAPAAPVMQPIEPITGAAKAAESTAFYAILRPLLTNSVTSHSPIPQMWAKEAYLLREKLVPGNNSSATANMTVDDYQVVAKFCPGSAPVLRDALSLYSAMAYVPESPDLRQLVMSAISACVLEARPMKAE